ncbi:hypothetical protein BJF78_11445 [Pseudonocardia sp. CNS-139]|nr:hypothetical protein BJF78_11445 [Pseudonocardia sp. CNS-139]
MTVCELSFHRSGTDGKYAPRPTFRRTNKDLADKPVPSGQEFQRISFEDGQDGYREFWRMIGFLYKFKELVDVGDFSDSYRVVSDESVIIHLKEQAPEDRTGILARYVEQAEIDASELSELLVLRTRKAAVEEFRKLLVDEGGYRAAYRVAHTGGIKGQGDEAVWHHFLSSNRWIFGLSLDLRFIEDFVDEASVGIGDTMNRGNPKADMLAWRDYTVLVELKTPDADIFTAVKTKDARANTWSFSPAFMGGFSQCLAQRSAWEESHKGKDIVFEDALGEEQELDTGVIRTVDPEVVFIYGNKDREIPKGSKSRDVRTKRDTLERLIRNNRNVNMISYDELYRRAYHIVYGELPPEGSTT